MAITAFVLAALPLLAFAAPARDGGIQRQPNFDPTRYLGKWYEIARSLYMPFELGTDNEANYALNPNGTIAVRNVEWRNDHWSEALAVATIVDNARLTVDFFLGPPGDYQVLQTDYVTYAIVYSAAGQVGPFKIQFGWILSRQTTLSEELINQAFQLFEEQAGMKRAEFLMTKHGVAPYPPPSARIAVRKDVPLQPDFNLVAYTGLWYEIFRTKNIPFESGTDINAFYAGNPDGTVAVTNKEWLPEKNQWKVANAVATYVSNARLSVKFGPLQPAGDYRVLYTDYQNIAVVYSEFNLGPISIKYGWVLSRVPSLTAELEAKAFQVFQQAAGMDRDLFHETVHGVAPKAA